MKNKILIFVFVLSICLSIFVVPSFAFDNDYVGEFIFKEDVSFDVGYPSNIDMIFSCNGVQYWQIQIYPESGTGGRVPIISYFTNADNEEVIVYYQDHWIDDSYRYLLFVGGGDLSSEALAFMNANEYTGPSYTGWYYDIYDMLHVAIFDGNELIGYQDLILSLFSFIFCLVAVSMPIIVILFMIKYVLGMRFV